ncbi:phosphoribosylformylglycinamidine synthase, partial [Clostridium polynesiense]|uniref:phosphoribosylformylglycinamidine synthase n=1 Tax=Clostridium polynesiense TaxID=1325933 RepID=UPI00058C4B26
MLQHYKEIYVEKKKGFDVEASALLEDFKENLRVQALEEVRLINQYLIEDITDDLLQRAVYTVFSEKTVDKVYKNLEEIKEGYNVFAAEYLPGQYDQRADAAMQCLAVINDGYAPYVKCRVILALKGNITKEEIEKIKKYYINPVEKREAQLNIPILDKVVTLPSEVKIINDFIDMTEEELSALHSDLSLAMSLEDLKLCQRYFKNEHRNPTETEIRVIDTYWSDHCRHTTFQTKLTKIEIENGILNAPVSKAYGEYKKTREYIYSSERDMTLMDIATAAMKELRKRGLLEDLDESDEINACTIKAEIETSKGKEDYLILFKNETHNHPTEIEPFGGAATCLGGAIRDPLSGRAYVYQAMRVTGSGDPNERVEDTLKGKLPQRKITLGAAQGYSSYGNQIGLATGQVSEVYDEGFKAKRMEIGAVIGAVPADQVVRKNPSPGDIVILLGGRTGRDGCGGAAGSSKEHNLESINNCGAEVQKGNAPVERKLQRFFRKPEASRMIKKCNDFGAGGVSVAIGELCPGLDINLDAVPKKYEGLNGTELAISESQERMAVVISEENEKRFIELAEEENLEATKVAVVTEDKTLNMHWRGKNIVSLKREFLDTNGAKSYAEVYVKAPDKKENYFGNYKKDKESSFELSIKKLLSDLNLCSEKGLIERFDSTIGASTLLMPLGGKYQLTPAEGMAAVIPVLKGTTEDATLMTYGYNPKIANWSP